MCMGVSYIDGSATSSYQLTYACIISSLIEKLQSFTKMTTKKVKRHTKKYLHLGENLYAEETKKG